jgi:hypothetical protein
VGPEERAATEDLVEKMASYFQQHHRRPFTPDLAAVYDPQPRAATTAATAAAASTAAAAVDSPSGAAQPPVSLTGGGGGGGGNGAAVRVPLKLPLHDDGTTLFWRGEAEAQAEQDALLGASLHAAPTAGAAAVAAGPGAGATGGGPAAKGVPATTAKATSAVTAATAAKAAASSSTPTSDPAGRSVVAGSSSSSSSIGGGGGYGRGGDFAGRSATNYNVPTATPGRVAPTVQFSSYNPVDAAQVCVCVCVCLCERANWQARESQR